VTETLDQSEAMGQTMLENGLLKPVSNDHPFKCSEMFYRWTSDNTPANKEPVKTDTWH
jgi:hypothetical protein